MRNVIILSLLIVLGSSKLNSQKWDRPMQLKACSIDIKADMFTATTFIEMEFYNSNDKEMEGLFKFELKPGQVITAFQLDLSGKYRDGSIEEKWKATNAYNTIVGKRIDPALLTMDWPNNYSLRIYPVPAKGSRKITMTIQQLLKPQKNELHYYLPLNVQDAVESFKLSINSNTENNAPKSNAGLISKLMFTNSNSGYMLKWTAGNVLLKTPIAFSIPIPGTHVFCVKQREATTHFALWYKTAEAVDYELHPNDLTVYWDASRSGTTRDVKKEMSFLQQFISYHGIKRLTLMPFNHKILDKVIFEIPNSRENGWLKYLQSLEYKGATQLGSVDLTSTKSDMFMIFTDGHNTYGKSLPVIGAALLYVVHASSNSNQATLNKLVGSNGGKVIELTKKTISEAIGLNNKAENWLLSVTSSSGKVLLEQTFPQKLSENIFVNGTMKAGVDTLFFHYGNSNRTTETERVIISSNKECIGSLADRVTMLDRFDANIHSMNWQNLLEFGLKEGIVTQNTAYIVLERIEDYVKYNIAPPQELEKECEKIGYVRRDTRQQRQQVEVADEFEVLNGIVNAYNARLTKWSLEEKPIVWTRDKFEKAKTIQLADTRGATKDREGGSGYFAEMNSFDDRQLSEVVVVGNVSARMKKELGYSVSYIQSAQIWPHQTVEQALQGRVAGLEVTSSTGFSAPAGNINIRGSRSLDGASEPLFVLDGIPITGNVNNYISTSEIESIAVLKDATATAIYGGQGANGVIVITSKQGRNVGNNFTYRSYRLKNMQDVEYLQEIKAADNTEKLAVYEKLANQYGEEPGFYLDVAQTFYEAGMIEDANTIMMNAIEVSNGSFQVKRAIGYIYENQKRFKDAILIYEQLRDEYPDNLHSHRDLAWAFYQDGQYQEAVNTLYAAIKMTTRDFDANNLALKSMMLAEMNAIISVHSNILDISAIPKELIRPMPADLRVVLDCNKGNFGNVTINEPGGQQCSSARPVTKNGGMFLGNNGYSSFNTPVEYQVRNAVKGKYRIKVNYYNYYSYPGRIPTYIRIVVFRNFSKDQQSISIENAVMDNQYGEVEIGEVKW